MLLHLGELFASADVVIIANRPSALQRLDDMPPEHPPRTWYGSASPATARTAIGSFSATTRPWPAEWRAPRMTSPACRRRDR